MKQGLPETPSIADWLNNVLPGQSRVGIDPRLISKGTAKSIQSTLDPKGNLLVPVMTNLVDKIWDERPAPPSNPIMIHSMKYAGRSHTDKIHFIRDELLKEGVDALVVTALDEIACTYLTSLIYAGLLNIRGSDINFNPVVISYVLVTRDTVALYTDKQKISDQVSQHLGADVQVKPYESIFEDIKQLSDHQKKVTQLRHTQTHSCRNCGSILSNRAWRFSIKWIPP